MGAPVHPTGRGAAPTGAAAPLESGTGATLNYDLSDTLADGRAFASGLFDLRLDLGGKRQGVLLQVGHAGLELGLCVLGVLLQLVDAGVDQRDGLALEGLGVALDLADAGLDAGEALLRLLLRLGGVATSELVGDLGRAGDGVQRLDGLGLQLRDVELGLSHVNLLGSWWWCRAPVPR